MPKLEFDEAKRHWNEGENNPNWKGGKHFSHGYVVFWNPDHPQADARGEIREARLIAEKALGKILPKKALPHHVDGKKGNSQPKALVICEDQAYHMLLHRRQRAFEACGYASWRKCQYCKKYDSLEKLHVRPGIRNGNGCYHPSCHAKYHSELRKKKNAKTLF